MDWTELPEIGAHLSFSFPVEILLHTSLITPLGPANIWVGYRDPFWEL